MDDGSDKRRASRRSKAQRGTAILSSWTVIDCRIEDVSETGAKLSFSLPTPMPDEFRLRFSVFGEEVRVERVWQRGLRVGVRFLSAPQVRPGKPKKTPPPDRSW